MRHYLNKLVEKGKIVKKKRGNLTYYMSPKAHTDPTPRPIIREPLTIDLDLVTGYEPKPRNPFRPKEPHLRNILHGEDEK